MSTDVVVSFSSSGYVTLERQIDSIERKLNNFGSRSNFANFDRQLGNAGRQGGAAFARNFTSSTNNLRAGRVAAGAFSSLGRAAGNSFNSAFAAATSGLRVGATAVAGAAALGTAAVFDSTRLAGSFEQQIRNTALITGAQGDELAKNQERLAGISRELGASTAFTAREVAQGLQFTSLAGFSVDESIAAIPGILSGAAATGVELADVSDIVTDNLSALGLAAGDSNRLVDVLVATTQKSNTDFLQLGQALSFAAVDGTALGESAETISAALGVLANNGIKATRGGTGLRRIFARLKNPTGEAADALEELGINVFDAEGNFRGLTTLLQDFNRVSQDLTAEQRATQFGDIFGIQGEGIATILLNNVSQLRELNAELLEVEGTADRVAAGQLDTLQGQVTILQSAIEGARLAFGEPLLEPFKESASGLSSTIQGLIPTVGLLGEAFSTNFVAPRVEQFTQFAAELGPQIEAAIAGQDFQIDVGSLFGFGREGSVSKLNIAELIELDFGAAGLQRFKIGSLFEFDSADGSAQYNIANLLTLDLDAAGGFRKINIGDFISFEATGGGEQLLRIGEFVTVDFAPLVSRIQSGLDTITGVFDVNAGANDPSELISGFDRFGAIAENIKTEISASVNGIEFDFSDFATSASAQATSILQSLNESIFGNTSQIGPQPAPDSLFPNIDALFEQPDTDVFSQFASLRNNVVDSLSGLLGDVLSTGTQLVNDINGVAIGDTLSGIATTIVDGLSDLTSIADLPGIANAASSLVLAIGTQFQQATSSEGFSLVGASISNLASNLIGTIGDTLGDPSTYENVLGGFTNVASGLLTGLGNVIGGIDFAGLVNDSFDAIAGTLDAVNQNINIDQGLEIGRSLGDAAGSIFTGIVNGLVDVVSADGFFTQLGDLAAAGVGTAVNFAGFAVSLVGGIVSGVASQFGKNEQFTESFSSLATFISDGLVGSFQGLVESVGLTLGQLLDPLATTVGFENPFQSFLDQQQADIAATSESFSTVSDSVVEALSSTTSKLQATAEQLQAAQEAADAAAETAAAPTVLSETGTSLLAPGQSSVVGLPESSTLLPLNLSVESESFLESVQNSLSEQSATVNAEVGSVEFSTDSFTDTYSVTAETISVDFGEFTTSYSNDTVTSGVDWGDFTNTYDADATVTKLNKGNFTPEYNGVVTITTVNGNGSAVDDGGTSAVANQQAGQNFQGTPFWRGGPTSIAEFGPEMVTLPNGARFLALNRSELNLPRGTRIDSATATKRQVNNVTGGDATIPDTLFREAAQRTALSALTTLGGDNTGGMVRKQQLLTTQGGTALVSLDNARVRLGEATKALTEAQSERALLGTAIGSGLTTSIQDSTALADAAAQLQEQAEQVEQERDLSSELLSGLTRGDILSGFGDQAANLQATFGSALRFLRTGTERFRGGWAVIGEDGPEIGYYPAGLRVFPADTTSKLLDMMPTIRSNPEYAANSLPRVNYTYNYSTTNHISNHYDHRVSDHRSRTVNQPIYANTVDPSLANNRAARAFGGDL